MASNAKMWVAGAAVVIIAGGAYAAWSGNKSGDTKDDKTSVALITDGGGIDDKSFNQSAWEGMKVWAKDNGVKEGKGGYAYYPSKTSADFTTNMDQARSDGFKNIYGIGFQLVSTINEQSKKNPNTNYMIIDDIAKARKNTVSVTFKSEQSSYLAGVAAAKTTKTNKVGFVGGMKSAVVQSFEKGFTAVAKSVNPDIVVDAQYVGSFTDAGKGKTIASTMYQSGTDVVFTAAGGSGAGVFTEAKDLNKAKNAADKVWVIGVDRDQNSDGAYTAKDGKSNFTLTSSVKKVGKAVTDVTEKTAKGNFPGGKHLVYGLDDKGVALTRGHMSKDAWSAVQDAEKKIINGDVKVSAK
jgi:basic membrane protein A